MWTCDYCEENELQGGRNCRGEHPSNLFQGHGVFDQVLMECPVGLIDEDWVSVVNTILSCEGGGMSINRIMPSQLFEETAFYVSARRIILFEQRRIEQYKKMKEEKKNNGK